MVFSQQVQSSVPSEFYRCERYEDVPSYSNAAILSTTDDYCTVRDTFCQQFLQVISRKIYGSVKLSFVHDHQHRKWLHLDTCQFMRLVESDVPRIMCPKRCCQPLPVAWTGPGSRYSLLFELFVLSWLKISTVDAVRKQLKISWNAVDGIMTRVVKRGLSRMKKPLLARHMNVDEVAFKKV